MPRTEIFGVEICIPASSWLAFLLLNATPQATAYLFRCSGEHVSRGFAGRSLLMTLVVLRERKTDEIDRTSEGRPL
jgi:hypothetical protein